MDPTLISAGIGLLSSVFGGKPKTPGYLKHAYDLQNGILKRGTDLYDNTDLVAQDKETVDNYGKSVWDQAMHMLQNYDSQAAGGGSPIWKGDTLKDRSRTQIAGDSASQIAQLASSLASTRADRKAALLPNPSSAAAGFQGAMALDQQAYGQQAANTEGLMNAAQLVAALFNKQKGTASAPGRNDRYVGTGSGAPIPYGVTYQPPMGLGKWMGGTYGAGYHG